MSVSKTRHAAAGVQQFGRMNAFKCFLNTYKAKSGVFLSMIIGLSFWSSIN
jgi:hypothetical protein